jgi:DNA-binding NtrC family response regulator
MQSGAGQRVLVIDDDPWIRVLVERLLGTRGYEVVSAADGAGARAALAEGFDGVVVLDVNLPDVDGSQLLRQLRVAAPDMPVILLTGQASTDLALDSIREGAFDFLEKTQLTSRLPAAVDAAHQTRANSTASSSFAGIVARSPAMRAVFRAVQSALPSRVPVLVRGESGTGKELIARALHAEGPRRREPFVAINCAGFPDNLLEAELFGYERGAFTGATARKLGRFDLARRGTLFLDEIGDMPLGLQSKLLRVLQEGEFVRLGGVETIVADVRIISATHRDLEAAVAAGRFREDLYYRLSVYTVHLPPLRERTGDVAELARHFVRAFAAREGKAVTDLDPRVLELLDSYRFPGNVRELENLLAHAMVTTRGPVLGIADLPQAFLRAVALERRRPEAATAEPAPARIDPPLLVSETPPRAILAASAPAELRLPRDETRAPVEEPSFPREDMRAADLPSPDLAAPGEGPTAASAAGPWAPDARLPDARLPDPRAAEIRVPEPARAFPTLREMERRHVDDALRVSAGNKTEAARLLGVSRMRLYRMLRDLGLATP